jgi:peptidoglycan hydrolase-like protein with peptidoglycan-binding domain
MRKILSIALLSVTGVLFASIALSAVLTPEEQRTKDLQAQIDALKKELLAMQKSLAAVSGTPQTPLRYNLYRGVSDASTGGEVSRLQAYLSEDTKIYPEQIVSGYFGGLTEKAVQRWQAKNRIVSSGSPATTGYGVIGPKTRAAVNAAMAKATAAPMITKATATSSPVGKSITLTGTGFLPTGNIIRLGDGIIRNIDSKDTKTIVFTVPQFVDAPCSLLTPPCPDSASVLSPGRYTLFVANRNGTSNALLFTVTSSGSATSNIVLSTSGTIYIAQPLTGTVASSNSIYAHFGDLSLKDSLAITQKGLPKDATASVGGCSPQPCSRKNTVTIRPTTPTGTYQIQVTATSKDTKSITGYTLIVTPSTSFSFGLEDPRDIAIAKPLSGTITASNTINVLYKGGVSENVTVTQTGFPTDVTGSATLSTCKPGCSLKNNISVRSTSKSGNYTIFVTATNGKATSTVTYTLSISDAVPFTYTIEDSGDISITRPSDTLTTSSDSNVFYVTHLTGYKQTMSFLQTGLPSGATATSIASCTTTCTRTNTISVRSTTPTGSYPITVTVTSSTIKKTTSYTLIIR